MTCTVCMKEVSSGTQLARMPCSLACFMANV
ncbi:hypothetical protein PanWU01x14_173450 [Parasponia andersonii]|uniref:Uncharacterized protein n=1 Tax=Parasponia andersonii TaxID=3476 RepID=A0A2P5C8R1_PARAD|nr:hypothetical protein PanWU01x14_173450 [Parasponia andersonii]